MDNEKLADIIDRLAVAFKELQALTGDEHISAFMIRKSFFLNSYGENNLKIERTINNE